MFLNVFLGCLNATLRNFINSSLFTLYSFFDGVNLVKEADEETRMRVDDLQPLLVQTTLLGTNTTEGYYETQLFPTDYLYQKRLKPYASGTAVSQQGSGRHAAGAR